VSARGGIFNVFLCDSRALPRPRHQLHTHLPSCSFIHTFIHEPHLPVCRALLASMVVAVLAVCLVAVVAIVLLVLVVKFKAPAPSAIPGPPHVCVDIDSSFCMFSTTYFVYVLLLVMFLSSPLLLGMIRFLNHLDNFGNVCESAFTLRTL
jgi:hypothetical protein